ncbi:hypothetical protein [Vibrio ostreicida]|uniref:hypothetical protein n=1 Tax=Vibrio ostreicida TaxID=526588 RepID=UPI0009704D88|nr:hypothetical protein [Vibrio ostreicida]
MKTKLLLGVSVMLTLSLGVGYYLAQPYLAERAQMAAEEARIEKIAEQLKWRKGNATKWVHNTQFEMPDNPQVGDWNIEQVKVPQVLFTIANPEDPTRVSYWSLNIDGSDPSLLIPEGRLPVPPQSGAGTKVYYGKFMSRSPNGRYLVIPQTGGTVLYDLDNGEITPLGEEFGTYHDIMWAVDSSQVVIKKHNELTRVTLPSKEVLQLTDVYGSGASTLLYFSRAAMSRADNRIYLHLQNNTGGGWFYCHDPERDQFIFEGQLTTCGNTIVIDAETLKVTDRGDFTPSAYDCTLWGSKFADGFYCTRNNQIYRIGKPSQPVGTYRINGYLVGVSGGETWFTRWSHRNVIRLLAEKSPDSPTTRMYYTFGAMKDGQSVELSSFGFGFSRYVLEHSDSEKWSDYLAPLPSYTDLKKALALLRKEPNRV